MSLRILLADDHGAVRDGLQALLEREPGFTVVAAVANGREAVREALRLQPDAALLDVAMPEMNGIEALRLIAGASPHTKVMLLSMYADAEHVFRALEAGAAGYLLKDADGKEVVAALHAVQAGRRYLGATIEQMVVDGFLAGDRGQRSPLESLSRRERDIVRLVADGCSNADIARQLALSVKTVETYRSRLMRKLRLRNVAQLVKFAVGHGLAQAG